MSEPRYRPDERTAMALERIADTFDDYMDMTLTGIEITNALKASDPAFAEAIRPLMDVLVAIRERRS